MAKRWASSRSRWSRYSASDWRGMSTGSAWPGTYTSSNRLASDATGISSLEPEVVARTRSATPSWPLPPSTSSSCGGYGELPGRSPARRRLLPLGQVGGEPPGQHLLHGGEVVVALDRP